MTLTLSESATIPHSAAVGHVISNSRTDPESGETGRPDYG
jgi:hypothetical protein